MVKWSSTCEGVELRGLNDAPRSDKNCRAEGIPLLVKKFQANAETCLPPERVQKILALFEDVKGLERMAVDEFVEQFVTEN